MNSERQFLKGRTPRTIAECAISFETNQKIVIANSISEPAGGTVSALSLVHQFLLRPFPG